MKFIEMPNGDVAILKKDSTWSYLEPSPELKIDKLRAAKQPEEVVKLFEGLFERMGVNIIETDEKFTVIHCGNEIKFEAGIDETNIDYFLNIYGYQIDYVVHNIEDGYKDDLAKFYLIRQFFISSPSGKNNLLNNPLISNPLLRWIIKGKNLIHVYLVSPDPSKEQDAHYTLFYLNGHWNIAQGLVSEPKRIFRVTIDDAMELEKNIFSGMKNNSLKNWMQLAKWYIDWRSRVEVPNTPERFQPHTNKHNFNQ